MCDCIDITDDKPYRWIIKPNGDLFNDEEIDDLETELVITIDTSKEEPQYNQIHDRIMKGDFFWLVDQGDGVLYKIQEFTDTGYILEDEPWTSEGTKI